MSAASEEQINEWINGVSNVHSTLAVNMSDELAARDAVAIVWSGNGFRETPDDVQRMFTQLVEIGYLTALRHVREGIFDAELRAVRPFD